MQKQGRRKQADKYRYSDPFLSGLMHLVLHTAQVCKAGRKNGIKIRC
jgi:hypothetical protein